MKVAYTFTCDAVSTEQLEQLFRETNLGGRVGDKIRRAFVNSSLVCFAYDDNRLIGASRAMTDGEYHGFIYDVAVLPEYQKHGIGRQMMKELLARMRVWRVLLVADSGVQGFYRKLGFQICPDVMGRLDPDRLLE